MKKVAKFGGTSLASASQFKKVYDIIKSDSSRVYIVPSAPGKRFKEDIKVTDLFHQAYDAYLSNNKDEFNSLFQQIKDRYQEIIDELNLTCSLKEEFDKIEEVISENGSLDYVLSRGEYLNGIVLASYLGFPFIDAAKVIYIDEEGHYDASKTDSVLKEVLANHEHLVIPGFYGALNSSPDKIKTFSRGGSDISGSIVAKCGEVDVYENWTDVSGFLMADPRIVKNPETIDVITYRELRELSYMGASVLHENSIFPIRKLAIPIHIKNTNRPEDKGTQIVESTCFKPRFTITGVTGKKDFATIHIEKEMMNDEIGFGRRVLQVLEDHHVSFEHLPTGIDTMTVVVHTSDFLDKEQDILSGIYRAVSPDLVELDCDLALIAVVGRHMKSGCGVLAKITQALAKENINIKMMDQGSSELNIIIGVKNDDFKKACKIIYQTFVEKDEL